MLVFAHLHRVSATLKVIEAKDSMLAREMGSITQEIHHYTNYKDKT